MSFRSRSAMSCFLFARKKESVRPLFIVLAGTLRTRDDHSAGKSDPSMPAEAKALISAKFPARATPRPAGRIRRMGSSPLELWFPYAPITEPSTIMFAPVSAPPALLIASLPSQTISMGHFWLLMDVDLLMALS